MPDLEQEIKQLIKDNSKESKVVFPDVQKVEVMNMPEFPEFPKPEAPIVNVSPANVIVELKGVVDGLNDILSQLKQPAIDYIKPLSSDGRLRVSVDRVGSTSTFPIVKALDSLVNWEIKHAQDVIYSTYGVNVSVDAKKKDLVKYGRNVSVGTSTSGYTIWDTGADQAHETYAAANTNPIDSISSASGDTVEITIEGHTETGGNKTFVTQNITLQGTTRVPLTTPLNRATRAYNNGSTDLAGAVYVYENTAITTGKPSDTTKIHVTIPAGKNQSEKASTSLSSTDYWIITRAYADILTKTGTVIADVSLQIRINGKVFRSVDTFSATNSARGVTNFKPYLIAPANSDIRLVAIGSATADISGGIDGYLAKVV